MGSTDRRNTFGQLPGWCLVLQGGAIQAAGHALSNFALCVFGGKDVPSHLTSTQAVPDCQMFPCTLERFNARPADVQESIDSAIENTADQNQAKVPSVRNCTTAELGKARAALHWLTDDQLAEWQAAGG